MSNIVIFSGYFVPHLGGIERYIDNLSKQFVKKNVNVIIVTSNYNNDKDEENVNGIEILRLPIFNIFKNRYPIIKKNSKYRKIISKLDNYKIDAIIVNTRFHLTSHIGAQYGKKKNIPTYLIEHGSNYVTLDNKFIDFFANRYEDFLTWLIKGKIKDFYGVSNACGKWLKNFNIESSGTWYNSIDCEQKIPRKTKHDGVNFMYAGRLIKQKGIGNILSAFSKLEKEYKNIHLFIAGDGPEYDYYKNEYKSGNTEFLGKLEYQELLKYYAKTDVFLYPPLWPEGLPTSILEAGLMKCAVIVTDQGGIKEIVNSKNGLIVDSNVESLYNGMKLLIDNPVKRNSFVQELNKTIREKFSWDKTSDKILKDMGVQL